MCTFEICYSNGQVVTCEHIKEASYTLALNGNEQTITVAEADLAKKYYPLDKELLLLADNTSFNVGGDGVRYIKVTTE